MKYSINKEFLPYSLFAPPIRNAKVAGFLGSMMKTPRWLWHDREVTVTKNSIKSYDGKEIELLVFTPKEINGSAPCLVYYHGGGFFFGAAGYHYKLAKRYALGASCKVAFVQYRLAPKNPHPTPAEDSYAGLRWVYENAEQLGIDRERIAVGGDSAGGALAAAVCQMARDRGTDLPLFQLLVYPVTDRRMNYESCRTFTDTPMWNVGLSAKMWQGYIQDHSAGNIAYASPMEAKSLCSLPRAYVETAEYDCLHDEGAAYADSLRLSGVDVELYETRGTMHGFDIVEKAPTARAAVARRTEYMKAEFYK